MPGEPLSLRSRRPLKGTVALADALGVALAQLRLGPDGFRVERFIDLGDAELPPEYASGDPVALANALQEVMKEHGLGKSLTCLGLDDSLTGASLADLPEAKGKAMTALVGRHVRDELPMQQAPVLADMVRVAPRQESDPLTRSWVAWSDRELMTGVANALSTRGISVDRVVPPSVALLDMLGRTSEGGGDRIELVVRFCWPSVVIGVYAGGSPQYARFLGDLLVDATEDPVDAGITELHRTVAFVRERNRGRQPDVVWHTGLDTSRARDFEQRLEEGLGIPGAQVEIAATGDIDAGRRDRLTVLASLLYHGAERKRGREHVIDLLPDPPKGDHWMLAGLGAALLSTAALSFANFESMDQGNLDVGARRASLGAEDTRLRNGATARAKEREQLTLREAWQNALSMVPTADDDPVRPLLDTLLLTPDRIRMNSALLTHGYGSDGTLSLGLSGDFTGGGSEELSAFLAALERRSWSTGLSAERGSLAFSSEGSGASEDLEVEVTLR